LHRNNSIPEAAAGNWKVLIVRMLATCGQLVMTPGRLALYPNNLALPVR
jgi:hypothetical protein